MRGWIAAHSSPATLCDREPLELSCALIIYVGRVVSAGETQALICEFNDTARAATGTLPEANRIPKPFLAMSCLPGSRVRLKDFHEAAATI